jgi:protein-tyrosine phosphatase
MNSQNYTFTTILNFRDLGGITAGDGKKIRQGVFFRSANPDRPGKNDADLLRSLNIRTIVDLRAPHEVNKKSVSLDHAERICLPLDFQKTTHDRLKPVIRKKGSESLIADISNEIYLEILDAAGPVFRQVMEILSSDRQIPLLIHCQAGKDRTGIISALVMLSLGVSRKEIVDDFMKSNPALLPSFKKHFLTRSILTLGYFPYRKLVFAVSVRQRNIESLLDRVENHYGGIEGFMDYAGFDRKELGRVRDNLLEDMA